MSKFWSPALGQLTPYTPGEQPKRSGLVKLNTNENPFSPSPAVAGALRAWPIDRLRLYPDPDSTVLREALAREHSVGLDHVFVGNGSDEVLAHAFCALLRNDRPILIPDVTYAFYKTFCDLYGVKCVQIPLDAEFRIDVRDYKMNCGGVVLANPNAPTGHAIGSADIEHLLELHPDRVVVIDEAYVDFGGLTAVPLLQRHANLLVVRTFSKSRGLAGIRVGYALGNPDLIAGLNRVKNSFNSYPLSALSVAAGVASLEDRAYFNETVAEIIRLREFLTTELEALGMRVRPSSANFVFASHPTAPALRIAAGLRERGVLVRHFDRERITNFLRITVGARHDCQALVTALSLTLAE